MLDVQFFQCVGQGRAVSWYARRGALHHGIAAGEGAAARAAEAARAVALLKAEEARMKQIKGDFGGVVMHRSRPQMLAAAKGAAAKKRKLQAGAAAGCRTILIGPSRELEADIAPTAIANDFTEFGRNTDMIASMLYPSRRFDYHVTPRRICFRNLN